MTPKEESEKIEKNLRQDVADGKLQGTEFNSTFIEFWYLREHCNVKILVNGEGRGDGWPGTSRTLKPSALSGRTSEMKKK